MQLIIGQLVSVKKVTEEMIIERSQLKNNWTNANLSPS